MSELVELCAANRRLQTFSCCCIVNDSKCRVGDDLKLTWLDDVARRTMMTLFSPALDEYYVVFLLGFYDDLRGLSVASLNIFSPRCSHPPSCHIAMSSKRCCALLFNIFAALHNILCFCNKFYSIAHFPTSQKHSCSDSTTSPADDDDDAKTNVNFLIYSIQFEQLLNFASILVK